jgi:hypothetical protein
MPHWRGKIEHHRTRGALYVRLYRAQSPERLHEIPIARAIDSMLRRMA